MNLFNKLAAVGLSTVLLAGLTACDKNKVSDNAPNRPDVSVVGVAHDAPIRDGLIRIYEWNGEKGKLLGEATTDRSGNYSAKINSDAKFVLLEIVKGDYNEEVSGKLVKINPNDKEKKENFLFAIAPFSQTKAISTNITYFTHISVGLAEYYVKQGKSPAEAVKLAVETISGVVGYDILATHPVDITDENQLKNAFVTNEADYGFNTAAISLLTADISKINNSDKPLHFRDTSLEFAKLAYADIKADGKLDGQNDKGQVYMQTVRITPDFYQKKMALAKLKIAGMSLNKTGLAPKALLDRTIKMNASKAAIFSGAPSANGGQLSFEKPSITEFSVRNNQVLTGTNEISFKLLTKTEIAKVEFFIDGVKKTLTSPELNSYSYSFDTTKVEDGLNHKLVVKATDILESTTEYQVVFVIANNDVTFSDRYPANDDFVRGQIYLETSVSSNSEIKNAQFEIGNQIFAATVTDKGNKQYTLKSTQKVNTALLNNGADGQVEYVIKTTNVNFKENTSEKSNFVIDNTKPNPQFSVNADQKVNKYVRGMLEINVRPQDTNIKTWKLTMAGRVLCTSDNIKATTKPVGYWDADSKKCEYSSTNLRDKSAYPVLLEAIDKAGNAATAQTTLAVANEPLIIRASFPAYRSSGKQTFSAYARRGGISKNGGFYLNINGVKQSQLSFNPNRNGRYSAELCAENIFGETSCSRIKQLYMYTAHMSLPNEIRMKRGHVPGTGAGIVYIAKDGRKISNIGINGRWDACGYMKQNANQVFTACGYGLTPTRGTIYFKDEFGGVSSTRYWINSREHYNLYDIANQNITQLHAWLNSRGQVLPLY